MTNQVSMYSCGKKLQAFIRLRLDKIDIKHKPGDRIKLPCTDYSNRTMEERATRWMIALGMIEPCKDHRNDHLDKKRRLWGVERPDYIYKGRPAGWEAIR